MQFYIILQKKETHVLNTNNKSNWETMEQKTNIKTKPSTQPNEMTLCVLSLKPWKPCFKLSIKLDLYLEFDFQFFTESNTLWYRLSWFSILWARKMFSALLKIETKTYKAHLQFLFQWYSRICCKHIIASSGNKKKMMIFIGRFQKNFWPKTCSYLPDC